MSIESKCDQLYEILESIKQHKAISLSEMTEFYNKIKEIKDLHKKEQDTILDAIHTRASIASMEYTLGEYNHDNEIGNKIAEEYRKDMNEGKCFAYGDCKFYVEQTFNGNYKVVEEELEIAKANADASNKKIEDLNEQDLI